MTDNAVYYNDAKDWEDWQMEFRKRAEGEDVWQYIEPTSDLPWPQEPTPPNIADYQSNTIHANTESNSSGRSGRSQTTGSAVPQGLGDLSDAGRLSFQQHWNEYTVAIRRYETIKKSLRTLREWVLKTVNKSIQKTDLPPNGNLNKWYAILAQSGEEYASHRMEDARIAFKNHLRSAPKKEAGLEKWIVRWKELMAEGQRQGVPETTEPRAWALDFVNAVEETAPLWASNYRLNKLDAVNNREVSYREVATNLLREIANRRNRSAVPRGSYKAGFLTLHGKQADQDDTDQDDRDTQPPEPANLRGKAGSKGSSSGRGGKKTDQKRKRKESDAETESGRRCKACLAPGHSISSCFYVFPEKAPEGFRFNEAAARFVKIQIESDTAIKEEVNRLSKKAKLESDD
ncbi:uncharacterized protein NECHADRAFT_88541 [Fusarium vanettenii 77-13-4]|uniref:Gag protein n=1 Tax=Fusarium vanettenii (strain ATCC MYA-4622 / CBS 123669 / FGSC 9596 / NRRL 45880 / 77-13-4) TaxID=660122 RepID=C7ZBT8_FUSV7|nr:uncharacterized protein NECHADRAFT_88541 [Fusarium vanettenii 77-13-4]EEU38468.1 hypothetical protein NECHADRAFT_88541 [Fusarium vanettenii 77-13-4]